MKLVGTMTLKTEEGDLVLTNTKDVGAGTAQIMQHALHTLVGSMVNDIAAHPGVFKVMSVTVED